MNRGKLFQPRWSTLVLIITLGCVCSVDSIAQSNQSPIVLVQIAVYRQELVLNQQALQGASDQQTRQRLAARNAWLHREIARLQAMVPGSR